MSSNQPMNPLTISATSSPAPPSPVASLSPGVSSLPKRPRLVRGEIHKGAIHADTGYSVFGGWGREGQCGYRDIGFHGVEWAVAIGERALVDRSPNNNGWLFGRLTRLRYEVWGMRHAEGRAQAPSGRVSFPNSASCSVHPHRSQGYRPRLGGV